MSKRFMLSAAGVSAAAIGASASAAILQFHYDPYAGEAGWSVSDSDGNVVASMGYIASGASGSAFVSSAWGYWNGSSNFSGYIGLYNLDLAAGDYSITLTDTWGDGWSAVGYGYPVDGSDAFVYGSYTLAFTTGSSVTGSFTVVPAPGALALLGLAGLAGTRRRRA